MACAKCAGESKHNLLKNAKGRLYYFLICPTFYFFLSPSCLRNRSLVPVGNLCTKIVSRDFFETEFLPGHIATNVYVYAVRGIGGLKNGVQRNDFYDSCKRVFIILFI